MAQQDVMGYFKGVLIVMLFYSFIITTMAYAVPDGAKNYVTGFSEVANDINLQNTSTQVQNSLTQQTNIPVIELGALVFYSGNIIVDLLLNFAFAIPQMISLLINGILMLLNVNSYFVNTIQLFTSATMMIFYIISIIQLLTNIRTGRVV